MRLHKECNHEKLIARGFCKCGQKYKINIPIYKYKNTVVIELRIQISHDFNAIEFEVMNADTNRLYVPFYYNDYPGEKGNKLSGKVRMRVKKEFKRLQYAKIIDGEID